MNVVSKWKEIAATLGLTAGLVAVGHETYEHFYTREEAENEHQEIIEVIKAEQQADRMRVKNDRIDRHDREIARLERDLQTDGTLSPEEKSYIVREISRLEDLKKCIRSDSC